MWTTIFVSGISLGSFYVLVALGFALIFGVTRNFNLAHGELLVLAGYSAYWLWKAWAFPFVLTFPFAILVILLVCLGLQRLFSRLRDPIELNSIVLSFGVAILIQNPGKLYVLQFLSILITYQQAIGRWIVILGPVFNVGR